VITFSNIAISEKMEVSGNLFLLNISKNFHQIKFGEKAKMPIFGKLNLVKDKMR
jgi:hypothetical protein